LYEIVRARFADGWVSVRNLARLRRNAMVVILALIVSSAAVGAAVAACQHPNSTRANGDGTSARRDRSTAIDLDASARAGRCRLAESGTNPTTNLSVSSDDETSRHKGNYAASPMTMTRQHRIRRASSSSHTSTSEVFSEFGEEGVSFLQAEPD
jgi:hypothetical protein